MAKKRIAVLTSGGDAPGMNAAVRAVVRSGIYYGMDVYGIQRGYAGLLEEDITKLNLRSVSNILNRGGTMLHSSRSMEFMEKEGQQQAADICRARGFAGVVCIGGDGTFRGAQALSREGITCIGIPGTIDNDIACSEYTLGFDTAINTAVEMADKIRDTTESHDRCSVIEVMGRRCGDIAINTAIAIGAFSVLIPEVEYDFKKDVIDPMIEAKKNGKKHFVIVAAEGVGHSEEIADEIERATGFETRATILGHVQRGGIPTEKDRVMGGIMGDHAVNLIKNGSGSRVVAVKNGEVTDYDINDALEMKRVFNKDIFMIAHRLSI